jgi:ABC-2 type transport system permease protein
LNTLKKIISRLRVQAYLDFMWMTRDSKLCLINIVSDIILNLAGVAAVFLLATRFEGIGIWSRDQIVFMLGYAALVRGIMDMGFSYNVLHISRRIGRGQMDHVLIQPQPVWMAFLTEGFMPFSGIWAFLTGVGITAWAILQLNLTLTFYWGLLFALHLFTSCIIVLAFSFLWGSLAFWAPLAAEEISSRAVNFMYQLKSFPLDGLGPYVLLSMLTVLPVGFVAWYPARQLLGLETTGIWHTTAVAMILSLVAFVAFKKGMKHYEQTGSQRYLGWGHRN